MHDKTVFVVGAGASKEVMLPTGYELKKKIASLLDIRFEAGFHLVTGDRLILGALSQHRDQNDQDSDLNSYLYEAWKIRDALPYAISIDNFIDAHRENEKIALCGKLAIVRAILKAERESYLFFEQHEISDRSDQLEKTWFSSFFQLLTENCGVDDLKERFQSIALIIFNYDRCIEHFLFHALQLYYQISESDVADLVKSIEIYHPYGSVGCLPWLGGTVPMKFGAELNVRELLQLANEIKTFAEGTDPNSSEILAIRSHLSKLNKLVFMGFGFHKLNMELIKPKKEEDINTSDIKCFATTLGISSSDKEAIHDQINELYNSKIDTKMKDLVCSEFFNEFWRSLSF